METIHHYVNGTTLECRSGRTLPVYNPATGEQAAEVGLASVEEVDAAVRLVAGRFPRSGVTRRVAARTKLMHSFRNLVEANAAEIAERLTAEHGKVHSDALGEGRPGSGEHRVRVRLGRPAQGQLQLPGVHRSGRAHRAPAVGGGGRYHAVQLPGHGAALDDSQRRSPAGNTFVLKPSERDPSAPRFVAELFLEAGFPPGVLNVVNGDKGGGGPAAGASRCEGRQLRRLHPHRPLRLRDGHLDGASGSRLSRGPRTIMVGAARRRPGSCGRRSRLRGLRLGRGAVHGGVGGGCRGRRRRPPGGRHQGAHGQAADRARRRSRVRDGPAHHPASTATGWPATSRYRRRRGRRGGGGWARGRLRGRRGSSWGCRCWTG